VSSPVPGAGPTGGLPPVTRVLVLAIAAIGFLFDTYELLMFPVIGADAVSELVLIDPNKGFDTPWYTQLGFTDHTGLQRGTAGDAPPVSKWAGRMLWIAAVCGGFFGLLGGYFIDRFGRKTVMVASILIYSVSPLAAAYSTELWHLVLFRSTTFIGVCVELVAAVTWLAELFENKTQREMAIGWTLACASLGGIFVTEVFGLIVDLLKEHPGGASWLPVKASAWRYTLLTGLIPGALILLPYRSSRRAGCGRRGRRPGR
jgi:MFS family permease